MCVAGHCKMKVCAAASLSGFLPHLLFHHPLFPLTLKVPLFLFPHWHLSYFSPLWSLRRAQASFVACVPHPPTSRACPVFFWQHTAFQN
uniref:Secreted protein n=1 Tax=Equus asinus TaxID=9793 RepID=A0A9L0J4F5_EQUAS